MSNSNTPSPLAMISPHALAPATSSTVNKPLMPLPLSLQTPSIFTNKEWVVPPRPKPGRKPAADTPPTKRKAQNRAAQRAFRERRAARVGDLEEQMKQMEEEDEREQAELRARIEQLELELLTWREKYEKLEIRFLGDMDVQKNLEKEIADLRGGGTSGTEAIILPQRNPTSDFQDLGGGCGMSEQTLSGTVSIDIGDEVPMGCGGCSINSRCDCIDAAFNLGNDSADQSLPSSKRPPSPLSITHSKRPRPESYEAQQYEENIETDFTARFARQQPTNPIPSALNSSVAVVEVLDPCGFCQDNSTCICAQLAGGITTPSSFDSNLSIQRPHPPATPKNQSPPTPAPRVTGPGTCAQCLASPTSALFCKSLAATRSSASAQSSNSTALAPNRNGNSLPNASSAKGGPGSKLSCADTYVRLSKHPAFDRASEELGTWVPKLATAPGGVERTAFEVDAASVMGVLKFFDRRFGRQTQ